MVEGNANRHEGAPGSAVDGGRGDAPRQDHAAVKVSEQFGKIQQAICNVVIGLGDEPGWCTGIPVAHRFGAGSTPFKVFRPRPA